MLLTSVSRAGPGRWERKGWEGGGAEEAGVTSDTLASRPQRSVAHRPKGRNQRKRAVITFTWRLLHNTVDAACTWYAVFRIACFARRRFVLKLTGMGKHYMLPRFCIKSRWLSIKMLSTYTMDPTGDHMSKTKASSRKEVISPATVFEIKNVSDSVKLLSLQVSNRDFSFKAGQWVDTYIPGLETVGGFSMCSSPTLLRTQGILQLAIKFSKHPPAFWVHTKCKPGDTLQLRSGGDFYFDPKAGQDTDVLLIAGGVGINPLCSMVNHVADLNASSTGPYKGNILLLYSARTCSELIFRDQLESLSTSHSNINTWFFASRESTVSGSIKAGRISLEDIQKAVLKLRAGQLQVYLCGPSPMIQAMEEHCVSCHITKQQIFYERWW